MQYGVINEAGLDDLDVALWTDACDRQLYEACSAWNIPYNPVMFYSSTDGLPTASGGVRLLTIQRKLDMPGADGYHQNLFGLVFSRVLVTDDTPVTMSHELLEATVNPLLTKWAKMPDGREVAEEISDPVEGDTYLEPAKVGFTMRSVPVSNYVLPSYFDPNGKPPYDRMNRVTRPFEIRPEGYYVVRDTDGVREPIFAKARVVPGSDAVAAYKRVGKKLTRPESRIAQLLR